MRNIDSDMFLHIQKQLDKIENKYDIEILYAVESGSRGWGFSNKESDYDVRFIYKRPLDYYLSINPQKDTIDYFDGDLDFVGWDVKKALYLHWKSNPNLREWMAQKIVYKGDCDFLKDMPSFDKQTLKHHYESIAYNNWKRFVLGKENEMTKKVTKMYLYCIRCIFSWILIDEDIDAPLEIDELMDYFKPRLDNELFNNIYYLINYYRSNCEITPPLEDAINDISTFIDEQIKAIKSDKEDLKDNRDINEYNKRFRQIIKLRQDS